jgi:heptose I phosphotransferase
MTFAGLWQRLWHGTRRLLFHADWPLFAGPDWAERIMSTAVTDRYHAKQGRSTGRWVLSSAACQVLSAESTRSATPSTQHSALSTPLVVYLKRHHRLPWWQRLLATLSPGRGWSPAFAEWRHLHWAQALGVIVPEPLAVGEYIGPWFGLQSFLVVKELTGMLPLHEAIPLAQEQMPPPVFARWKRELIEEMARITRRLHCAQRYHKDLYLCHFFTPLTSHHSPPTVGLIDLHRLAHHDCASWYWQIKDLAQLLFSSDVAGIIDRDRLQFFHAYLEQARLDAASRRLLRHVCVKAERYRRHNAKRTQPRRPQEVRAA